MWITKRLVALEAMVARTAGRYAVGDALTLADVYIFPQLDRARRHDVEVGSFETLAMLEARLARIEAFVKTHPRG